MSCEAAGVDGSKFISKKQPEVNLAFPQNSANTKSDMCLYAACLDADWGDDVPKDHSNWIQATYDDSEKE